MNNWNGLDFIIFLIFFLNTIIGMSRGASKEIMAMMCLSVALIFTIRFTIPLTLILNSSPLIADVLANRYVGNFIRSIGAPPLSAELLAGFSYSLSVMICFTGIYSVTAAALNYTGFVEAFTFPWAVWSRKVGAGLGCTRGYVLTLLLISILMHVVGNGQSAVTGNLVSGSWFVNLFQGSVIRFDSIVAGQHVEQYQQIFQDKNLFDTKDIYRIIPQALPQDAATPPPVDTAPAPAPISNYVQ